jgi:CheY-like chemotaxis protein
LTTILYVEDDDNNAFMLTRRLHRYGLHVRHVDSGEKALLSAVWDPPAAVLLDVNLPGIDGLAVLRRLRADSVTRALPVIVVSASVQDAAQTRALAEGADAFVAKPIEFGELLRVLSRWLPVASEKEGQA